MNAEVSDDWQAALDRLYGFANWETRPPGTAHEFALDRIERLLDALGRPHHELAGGPHRRDEFGK